MIKKEFSPVWYTIPEFAEIIPGTPYHKEQEPGMGEREEYKNLHVLARTEFCLEHVCKDISERKIFLRITADDYYKAYVNGSFVGQGPAPAYPEAYYYNEIDISDQLIEGTNLIAVHAYYQGLINRVWNSGDGRFALAADVVVVDGGHETFYPISWEYKISHAYSGDTIGYETQFLENFDSRMWDENWNKLVVHREGESVANDGWCPMKVAVWADYSLSRQPTKMLDVYEIKPALIEKRENGAWFVDIGQEITGSLVIKAKGVSGQKIIIRCGEELDEDGSVRYDMRCNCRYEEIWTLDDGICQLEPYDYKGFRYSWIEAEPEVEILDVYVSVRHYPIDESYCTLETEDIKLKQIFDLCKNTIKYGTQDAILDCPTREKGQYLGDAVVAARSQVYLTGSTELLRKCIDQFAGTAFICPGLMAVAPGSLMQEIADYSLLWSQLLITDYEFTRDKAYLAEKYPVAKGILDYFEKYRTDTGLLYQVTEKWNLVDWPENLRDNYDFELSRPIVAPGYHNVINALYAGAVKALNQIEEILDYPLTCDFEKVRNAYVQMFYRPEKKLFADSDISQHTSLPSNLYPLYFELVPEGSVKEVAQFLIDKGLCCGVAASYYLLKGLARAGYHEDVYALLINESEHGWVNMLREGATTCFEAWGKDQKWNTSLCHPWATAPISIIIEDLQIKKKRG